MNPKLAYIVSLPRSGSTVLAALLDRRKGILSAPESSFPQMLGYVRPEERRDPRRMAALYLGSTLVPTPLSLDEAAACMTGSETDILTALGLAIARKVDRDPAKVEAIIWKTPQVVSLNRMPLSTNGSFIVIRRHPQNVFESQFRVNFGGKNSRPLRFALFRESYENEFVRLPSERTIEIEYDSLPDALDWITEFLGIQQTGEWKSEANTHDMAEREMEHMADVTGEFHNRDPIKRARLSKDQIRSLERAMAIARPFRSLLGPIRSFCDRRALKTYRKKAKEAANPTGS